MNRLIVAAAAAVVSTLACIVPAVAQLDDSEPGSVHGNGSAVIEQSPTLMRMTVSLSGEGKTLKEALSKLKDRSEAAVLQVEKLKADKKSIKVSEPEFSAAAAAQRAQIEQMMRQQRRGRGGRGGKAVELPQSVTVSSTLTAEWPLTAEGGEQLLLAAQELQEKVKAADLAGAKEEKQASAEEEEVAEEMAQMMEQYGADPSQMNQSEPSFLYVATVSDESRKKAIGEAFAKAKLQAARVAEAAGAKLGKIERIRSNSASESGGEEYYQSYEYRAAMMRQAMGASATAKDDEAASAVPGPVKVHVTVDALFSLEFE